MIYVDEKYLTIAGKKIPGQVQSVTITEEGKIEDKKNSKGKVTKANQPQGSRQPRSKYPCTSRKTAAIQQRNRFSTFRGCLRLQSRRSRRNTGS